MGDTDRATNEPPSEGELSDGAAAAADDGMRSVPINAQANRKPLLLMRITRKSGPPNEARIASHNAPPITNPLDCREARIALAKRVRSVAGAGAYQGPTPYSGQPNAACS